MFPSSPLLGAVLGLALAAASPVSAASFNVLRVFNPSAEGNAPQAELTQGTDFRFYGVNSVSGPQGSGSVFSLNGDGSGFSVLNTFGAGASNGIRPIGGLLQAGDGNFYGTTYDGGVNALGTLFRITPGGVATNLFSFNSGDPGSNPAGTLIEGIDGFLYGTAQLGGPDNFGTVFRADPATGAVATVSDFLGGIDGLYPQSDLVLAYDGNFYGTTNRGGTSDAGTIFRVNPAGVRTVIYSFTGNQDGRDPQRGLTLGRDGFLYGLTVSAGASNGGTIFRVSTSGVVTTLAGFLPQLGSPYSPLGRLTQGSDGNFYGTTNLGGDFNAGTIFASSATGGLTTVYSFTGVGSDGGYPIAGLVQGADGKFYGTAAGLNGQNSTIFQLDLGLFSPTPQPVVFTPATASVGDTVTIKGDYFLGTTGVAFTGSGQTPTGTPAVVPAASFTVASKTLIRAVVPAGAATGPITVARASLAATTGGILTVNAPTVTPTPTPTPTPPPVGGPVVNIVARDAVATRTGANNGAFKIRRAGGNPTAPLTVVIRVTGSATRGVDYDLFNQGELLPPVVNSVTIPAGSASTKVVVRGLASATPVGDERVTVKIRPGANYSAGITPKAFVILAGN